jgi:hypothetical protein
MLPQTFAAFVSPSQGLAPSTPAQNAVLQAAMYNFLMLGSPDLSSTPQLPMAELQRMFTSFAHAAAAVAAGTMNNPMAWPNPGDCSTVWTLLSKSNERCGCLSLA